MRALQIFPNNSSLICLVLKRLINDLLIPIKEAAKGCIDVIHRSVLLGQHSPEIDKEVGDEPCDSADKEVGKQPVQDGP